MKAENKYLSSKLSVRVAGLMLLLALPVSPHAISTMVMTPNKASMLMHSLNEIKGFGDSLLRTKLSKLGKAVCFDDQKITIAHIGDSHIQADIFTGEVRKLLSTYFNENEMSKGFCFPYSLIGSNNPECLISSSSASWEYSRIKASLNVSETGISGAAIQTTDSSASVQFRLLSENDQQYLFDVVRIYFDNDSLSYKPCINIEAMRTIASSNSITFYLSEHTNSIFLNLKKTNSNQQKFRMYGVEFLNSKSKLFYHAIGINGADVRSFLTSKNFENQIKTLNPDIVVLSLGTNDSYNPTFDATLFLKSYINFIDKIQCASPSSTIILTTPGDHLLQNKKANPNIKLVCEQIFAAAHLKHCLVWDFNSLMDGVGGIREWSRLGLSAPDYIHLSKQGYKLQGALFYDALVRIFENIDVD